jgi:beta-lactamase superfamily II metal-dependent hydrolase
LLRIWVLDVGHGDSLVLDYTGSAGRVFGVIDSNRNSVTVDPAATQLLRSLQVSKLSFVMLSHPHADHFRGLGSILDAFEVHTFYSYPMYRDLKRVKAAGAKYLDAAQRSGSATIRDQATEFASLVISAEQKRRAGMDWMDIEGPTSRVRPAGFDGVHINAMLPFKKVKGEYFNALDSNRWDDLEAPLQNQLSIALDIRYGEYQIALCGDATRAGWADHKRELLKSNESVSFSIAKLPHHGSADDCDSTVLNYLFPEVGQKGNQKIALISAPGSRHHPSPVVLKALEERKIHPYCTNLSIACGNNVRPMITSPTIAPEIVKFLNVAGAGTRTSISRAACQGNICVTIPLTGDATVQRQFNNACSYRGDFDFLSGT